MVNNAMNGQFISSQSKLSEARTRLTDWARISNLHVNFAAVELKEISGKTPSGRFQWIDKTKIYHIW